MFFWYNTFYRNLKCSQQAGNKFPVSLGLYAKRKGDLNSTNILILENCGWFPEQALQLCCTCCRPDSVLYRAVENVDCVAALGGFQWKFWNLSMGVGLDVPLIPESKPWMPALLFPQMLNGCGKGILALKWAHSRTYLIPLTLTSTISMHFI